MAKVLQCDICKKVIPFGMNYHQLELSNIDVQNTEKFKNTKKDLCPNCFAELDKFFNKNNKEEK